jgi:hypothetical protein
MSVRSRIFMLALYVLTHVHIALPAKSCPVGFSYHFGELRDFLECS